MGQVHFKFVRTTSKLAHMRPSAETKKTLSKNKNNFNAYLDKQILLPEKSMISGQSGHSDTCSNCSNYNYCRT